METGDWAATRDLNGAYADIRALGPESNLAELEAFGFTLIEGARSPDLTRRPRGAVLAAWEDRYGRRLDLEHETGAAELIERHGRESCMAQLLGANHFNGWREEGPDLKSWQS